MKIKNIEVVSIIWGLRGSEEDHQLHHCCWTGRVSEREEEVSIINITYSVKVKDYQIRDKGWQR